MNSLLSLTVCMFLLLAGVSETDEGSPASSAMRDEIRRSKVAGSLASSLSERVKATAPEWEELANGAWKPGRRVWKSRAPSAGGHDEGRETHVIVSVSVTASIQKAKELMEEKRWWGPGIQFPDLDPLFDEHRGIDPKGRQMVPPAVWSVTCRKGSVLIGIDAPTAEVLVRFASLVAMDLPRAEEATE